MNINRMVFNGNSACDKKIQKNIENSLYELMFFNRFCFDVFEVSINVRHGDSSM